MNFDNRKHLRIGSYPDMWDRTISVYSLGKVLLSIYIKFSLRPSPVPDGEQASPSVPRTSSSP
jgi:hypothetical protein